MSLIDPASDVGRRTTQQWIVTALGAGGMTVGLALFFFIEPHTPITVGLAAVLFAAGLAVGVFALYRAVRLIGEGGPLRMLGMISVLILVTDPLLIAVVGILV